MIAPSSASGLSIGQCASLACLLEVTASKPGNVHRAADFEDLTFLDFATSAVVIGSVFEGAPRSRLGELVLEAVENTRRAVGSNTNLGTLLLLAPLAMVPRDQSLKTGVSRVLASLDATDCQLVYDAIRLAQPGGLGSVGEADVSGPAPADLVVAMRLAAEHDLVARQYAGGFSEVLEIVVPRLQYGIERGWPASAAIVHVHLQMMRDFPDSLIARKCGAAVAEQAAAMAANVLAAGAPISEDYQRALGDLDFWLRADHHRRNPGTTADLLAAGLFALLRDGIIKTPIKFYA